MNEIEKNLFLIRQKINQTCKIYQRDIATVNLVAVSKKVATDKIKQAINAGCDIFGENYINEAMLKWPELKQEFPQTKLHFIGHLQTNKVKEAVQLFDCIETVDREKLANQIANECKKQNKKINCFIQVNIGQEEQKSGINPNQLKDFINFCKDDCGLNISGLMCIPPAEELASPYFALLAKLAKENNIKNLSMGMSADFEDAIALNSNFVRIGTAIFGKRQ